MPITQSFAGLSTLGFGAFPGGDFESIATVTLGSDTTYAEFTSIPSTFQHLQVRWICRTDRSNSGAGDYLKLQFNGDTGNNYARHNLVGNGSSASAGGASSSDHIDHGRTADAGSTANAFGAGIIDILDYASTSKHTTSRCLGGVDGNGTGQLWITSGYWDDTSAVTSLRLTVGGGSNLKADSVFALFGVKAP